MSPPATGLAHEAVLDDGIAAAMLGGVERRIRGFDQIARLQTVVRAGGGDADTDGDR